MQAIKAAAPNGQFPNQPRRSRARESDEQASLFLRKAYHLITNCPSHLGGWSETGETFVVKDAKSFAEKVIPMVYKHNNFSSFVRQLNFYGFRKVKSDLSSVDSPWWEFRHPKFIRGKPNLLFEMKRAVHSVATAGKSVSEETLILRSNIEELNHKLATIDKSISSLAHLVNEFIRGETAGPSSIAPPPTFSPKEEDNLANRKKRHLDDEHSHSTSSSRQCRRVDTPTDEKDYTPPTSFNRTIPPTQSSFTVSGGDDDDSSLDDLITFYTQQRDSAENPADYYIEEDDMDFEEFITFSSLMEEQKPAVEKLPQLQICKTESDESIETLQDKNTTPALLPVTTPVTVSDVPLIMSQLPLDLRIRFLEKFAESAALHFCAISTLPADGTARPCLCLGEASSHETQNPVALQKLVHDKINEMDLASRNWSRV